MPSTGISHQFDKISKKLAHGNVMVEIFTKRISQVIRFATETSVYTSEVSSTDLNTAQCFILSLLYSLSTEDIISSMLLIQMSTALEHLRSKYLLVWLTNDFTFDKETLEKGLKTVGKLISQEILEVPKDLIKIFCTLAEKIFNRSDSMYKDFPFLESSLIAEKEETVDEMLCKAVQNNNIADIILAARRGANVNLTTSSGGSLFHLAVSGSCLEAIAALHFLKVDIEVRDRKGVTPLLKAVTADCHRTVSALLSAGACINNKFYVGSSILHIAVVQGKINALNALLDSGTNVKVTNNNGETPILLAVKNKNCKSVELLLKCGANPQEASRDGESLLHIACIVNCSDIVRKLIKAGAKTDAVNRAKLMPLHLCRSKEVVKAFFECGVSLDLQSTSLDSALHFAVTNGFLDVAESLANCGANINLKNSKGETPLFCAVKFDNLTMVQIFLSYGADPNVKDNGGLNAVVLAAEQNRLALLRVLQFAGADLKVTAHNEFTVLHSAAFNGHNDIINFVLLDLKINSLLEAKCKFMGWSYYYNSYTNVANCFSGTVEWTTLHLACFKGHLSTVQTLIQSNACVDSQDNNNWTPLHLAVYGGFLPIVEALLIKGAKITKTAQKQTVCHIAADRGHVEVMNVLVQGGANVNEKGYYDWTPLHHATARGHLQVVEYLLDHGANINVRAQQNSTPLSVSVNNDISQLLRSRGAT